MERKTLRVCGNRHESLGGTGRGEFLTTVGSRANGQKDKGETKLGTVYQGGG